MRSEIIPRFCFVVEAVTQRGAEVLSLHLFPWSKILDLTKIPQDIPPLHLEALSPIETSTSQNVLFLPWVSSPSALLFATPHPFVREKVEYHQPKFGDVEKDLACCLFSS